MDKVILAFESGKTAEHIRDIIENSGLAGCTLCRSAAEVKLSLIHISEPTRL